jgi:hypothetical protein
MDPVDVVPLPVSADDPHIRLWIAESIDRPAFRFGR